MLLLHTPDSRLQGRLQAKHQREALLRFHIGPEFVEALTSRAVDESAVDTSPVVSDGTHPSEEQEHPTAFEHLASRLRAFLLAGVTLKCLHIVGLFVRNERHVNEVPKTDTALQRGNNSSDQYWE